MEKDFIALLIGQNRDNGRGPTESHHPPFTFQ
jgi:hypothetical protein